jgi:spore coat polysaccharide biosynthesis protein SpsF
MKNNRRIAAIIQARTGSTRFPNKVFAKLSNKPLIWHVFDRLKHSKLLNLIVLATTENNCDDSLVSWAVENNIYCFRGDENDVLSRYYHCAKEINADVIVRITADDPFKDPEIIDLAIKDFIELGLNFISNNNPPSFPEGLDVEVFDFKSLEIAYNTSISKFEREHVTQFFYKNSEMFKMKNLINLENLSNLRWTIDTEKDYLMVKKIYENLYDEERIFLFKDIINFLSKFPEISLINSNENRSSMYVNSNLNN